MFLLIAENHSNI